MSNSPMIACHKAAPAELNCKPDLTCFEQGCWQEQGSRQVQRIVSTPSGMGGADSPRVAGGPVQNVIWRSWVNK